MKLGKVKAVPQPDGTLLCEEEFPYRILGDDIVIWDDDVADSYQRIMTQIGCSISEQKSISSDRVAEFAGRVILRNCILHGMKYHEPTRSQDPADNVFMEQVSMMGPRIIRYLKPHQRKVANYLASCLQPVGLGWNPRGLSYWERYAMSMAWELSVPKNTPASAIVQIRQVFRNWYSYKYQSSFVNPSWSSPLRKQWNPLEIDQISSRPEFLGIPVEAFHGNVQEIRDFPSLNKGLKEEFVSELLAKFGLLSGGIQVTDRSYSKPLIEFLYPRFLRALELLPTCRAVVRSFTTEPW